MKGLVTRASSFYELGGGMIWYLLLNLMAIPVLPDRTTLPMTFISGRLFLGVFNLSKSRSKSILTGVPSPRGLKVVK